jgi:hypothetical protein
MGKILKKAFDIFGILLTNQLHRIKVETTQTTKLGAAVLGKYTAIV